MALIFYSIFYFFFFIAYLRSDKKYKGKILSVNKIYAPKNILDWKFILIIFIIMALFIFYPYFVMNVFIEQTNEIQNQPTFEIAPFTVVVKHLVSTPGVWLLLLIFIAVLVIGSIYFLKSKIKNEFIMILFILFMTFSIKYITVLGMVNNEGYKWISNMINNKCVTDYYVYTKDVKNINDLINFISNYTRYQSQEMGVALRMRTHPPLIAVIYWFLCRITDCSPVSLGFAIMFFTSFISILIYYIAKILTDNKGAGFASSILYIVSSSNVIQSKIFTDALITLVFGFVILFLILGNK